MKIGNRIIGDDQSAYVIAEIGVNHDGSVERGLELVDAAASAGADAIKLQLFEADRLMSKAAKLAAYQKAAGESDPVEMLRRLELSVSDMAPMVELAHTRGIHAIVTVFSVELIEAAERLAWDAYKTASPDIVHRPLLERLMKTGRPLIVSTGASTMDEVLRAVEWLRPAHDRLAVLQCVSSYPTPLEQAALGGMFALREAIDVPIGYSDHTGTSATAMVAAGLGACVLEKHLTYSKGAAGPDHAASLEPVEFAQYVRWARVVHAMPRGERDMGVSTPGSSIGPREKVVLDIEKDVRRVSRQSIVLRRRLHRGEEIRREDVSFKRPGTGLLPYELECVVGRRAAREIDADTPIVEADLG